MLLPTCHALSSLFPFVFFYCVALDRLLVSTKVEVFDNRRLSWTHVVVLIVQRPKGQAAGFSAILVLVERFVILVLGV